MQPARPQHALSLIAPPELSCAEGRLWQGLTRGGASRVHYVDFAWSFVRTACEGFSEGARHARGFLRSKRTRVHHYERREGSGGQSGVKQYWDAVAPRQRDTEAPRRFGVAGSFQNFRGGPQRQGRASCCVRQTQPTWCSSGSGAQRRAVLLGTAETPGGASAGFSRENSRKAVQRSERLARSSGRLSVQSVRLHGGSQ